ncbi:MAG: L-rhamnose mutarotase [Williamsia sp.]|nr:L-rhamnose mutarotase [Williamsia sp.]
MLKTVALLFFLFISICTHAQIWVAATGSDGAEGTRDKPLASVAMALRKARELRRLNDPSIARGIHITVNEGVYDFTEPLFIRPEDAGTGASPTTIEAAPGAHPVFSGGIPVKGWKKLSEPVASLPKKSQGRVWVAAAPTINGELLPFRQLWVNGLKAIRAKDRQGNTMSRILSWNKKDESCWIPKPAVPVSSVEGMELLIHQWWAIAQLRIKSMEVRGDSALLRFHQPESRIQSEHPWPSPWISPEGNSAFNLVNALQFLDSPGEWYLDPKTRRLYYWPREGEDMQTATVIAPAAETLVEIKGTAEQPVSHIRFKGISFQHTSWLRPSQKGHVPLQAGMYMLDAYKLRPPGTPAKKALENQAWIGRPAAAVEVSYARNTCFENCQFIHLASTGLDLEKGAKEDTARGNLFQDIGGSALIAGVFSDEAMETHLAYNPADEREITEGLLISNNLVNNIGNEDWGCVGIGAGYVRNTTIAHNDLSELPYTGISLGWGWTKDKNVMQNNQVLANKIYRYAQHMYDVAAIYTLGAQPNTLIADNRIDSIYKAPYAHLPHHWFYLYTDEGSSYITVKNNWTPSEKYLQNANGPGNVWENNGPAVAGNIQQAAGLEEAYRSLLSKKRIVYATRPINHELPVIIELIAPAEQSLDVPRIKGAFAESQVASPRFYQWKNHLVFYGKTGDAAALAGKLGKALPGTEVKLYSDAFYEFNRTHCADTSTAAQWDNILLTADLVSDPKLQQEYLAYHKTQFQQWPEVSNGFCNAQFQQLLVYRSGRQLMLVISIPRGESLDRLNPKTTENNPRVDEWNKRMARYQQGIQGTAKEEVWVFLKPVE